MKISLNTRFFSSSYGGGMKFANYLKLFLIEKKVKVINHLKDDDIDIILHINPFSFLMRASAYSYFDAYLYKLKHPNTIIILRVNECDERKNTNYINELLDEAARYSDFVVYISSWLKYNFARAGLMRNRYSAVILNGADKKIFNDIDKKVWDGKNKIRIVTHHWSSHIYKGHDIYHKLDRMLDKNEYRNKYEFTYIGNVPKKIRYRNTTIVDPLNGAELAEELKKHDIYLTGTINEPAGMHHIEGALCGLPILYRNSGALPEYCKEYGLSFVSRNFENKLEEISENYFYLYSRMKNYPNTSDKMVLEYYDLFVILYENRAKFRIKKRKLLLEIDFLFHKFHSLLRIPFLRLKRSLYSSLMHHK